VKVDRVRAEARLGQNPPDGGERRLGRRPVGVGADEGDPQVPPVLAPDVDALAVEGAAGKDRAILGDQKVIAAAAPAAGAVIGIDVSDPFRRPVRRCRRVMDRRTPETTPAGAADRGDTDGLPAGASIGPATSEAATAEKQA